MTQAAMTSTHGNPRLTWPAVAKVNIGSRSVGFEVCKNEERKKESREKKREEFQKEKEEFQRERNVVSRRLDMDDLTNRGIEVTIEPTGFLPIQ